MNTRVVVTGLGAVTPIGIGVQPFWENLLAGKCGVDHISQFDASKLPCRIGAEVRDFNASDHIPAKLARETDRFIHFGLVAARMALDESGLRMEKEDPYRVGVLFGTATGGIGTVADEQTRITLKPGARVSPHFMPKMLPNLAAAQIAMRYGMRGVCMTLATACATGSDVVGLALAMLRLGEADAILTGAADSFFTPVVVSALASAKAVSTRNDDPKTASRPFDRDRDGMVIGEGSAALMLETLDHARARSAPILAEVVGWGSCGEGYHVSAPDPSGVGEVHCMRRALKMAGLEPKDVDYVCAHGTSTPMGDKVEMLSVAEVLGDRARQVPMSSIKGATGHMIGAAGAVEMVSSVLTLQHGVIPPTINHVTPDPDCVFDVVPNVPKRMPVNVVMSNSFGFGGQDASVIVKKYEE